jgi:hydrogenase maturation factor HypF (carbamoyltransferase family)
MHDNIVKPLSNILYNFFNKIVTSNKVVTKIVSTGTVFNNKIIENLRIVLLKVVLYKSKSVDYQFEKDG